MKYMIILADGMSDNRIKDLGNKTPLQYAKTPNFDFLAKHAAIGRAATIPEGFPPGSDVANLSVMGYDPCKYYTGRSPLEAVSMGVELGDSDLALRCNLVTLSDEKEYRNKIMIDYSTGEISSEEAADIIQTLQDKIGSNYFSFYPGISYRHLVVWRDGIDKDIILTPPHDISGCQVGKFLPQGKDGTELYDLMLQSEKILKTHPVNLHRQKSGFKPANSIWLWGEGRKLSLPSFQEKYNLKGSVIAAVDLIKGLGICAGLIPVSVEGATGSIKTNFAGKARAALDELKRGQDFVYLHIESPDEAGHQGSLESKVWSIEQIDREVVGLVLSEMHQFEDFKIMLLPDHSTPLSTKTHGRDPVPFMIYDKTNPVKDGVGFYDEFSAASGLFFENGYELMDYFIQGTF